MNESKWIQCTFNEWFQLECLFWFRWFWVATAATNIKSIEVIRVGAIRSSWSSVSTEKNRCMSATCCCVCVAFTKGSRLRFKTCHWLTLWPINFKIRFLGGNKLHNLSTLFFALDAIDVKMMSSRCQNGQIFHPAAHACLRFPFVVFPLTFFFFFSLSLSLFFFCNVVILTHPLALRLSLLVIFFPKDVSSQGFSEEMTYHKFLFTYRFNSYRFKRYRFNTYLSLSLAHANAMQMPLHIPRNGNEYEIIHIIALRCLLACLLVGSLLKIFHY